MIANKADHPSDIEYRSYAAVNELAARHSASELGRIAQVLLALSFQNIGFDVSHFQQVGRPDFVAERGTDSYAVEVKAPSHNQVLLKREDLLGTYNLGHSPVIAVLNFPMLDTRWFIIASNSLSARVYSKVELKKYDLCDLSQEVNPSFLDVLIRYRDQALLGSSYVREYLRTQ